MITRDTMLEPVLRASPSFKPVWDEFLNDWENEPGDLPLYLLFGDLARHMARLFQDGKTEELAELFQIVESWQEHGDSYVKEAATVGILEDLQNSNLVAPVDPRSFEPFLGPVCREAWSDLQIFWARVGKRYEQP